MNNYKILCMICFLLIIFTILNGEEITTTALPIPSRLTDSSDQLANSNSSYVYTAHTAGRFVTLSCLGSDMGVNASSITFASWIVPWHSSLRCGIYMPAGKRNNNKVDRSNDDRNSGGGDGAVFNYDSHDADIVSCDQTRGVETSRSNLSLNIRRANTSFNGIYSCIAWRNSEAWKTIIQLTVQDKPTAPTLLQIDATSESTFHVKWSPPLSNNNSSITFYKVTWFKFHELKQPKQYSNGNWMRESDTSFQDDEQTISRSQSDRLLSADAQDAREIRLPEKQRETRLMDLTPYTRYCVEVKACNAIGWSPPVSSCIHRTKEGKPLFPPSVTPQPVNSTCLALLLFVQNLTHVSGQLRGFKVKLYQRSSLSGVGNNDNSIGPNRQPEEMLNQPPDRTLQFNTTKSSHAVFLNHLQPWTNYEIRVCFFNTRFDSPGITTIINTKEGVPEAPRYVNLPVKTLLSTSVKVNWVQPRNLNGRLIGYEVQYFKRKSPNVYLFVRTIAMDVGNEIVINKLEPATEYRVRVAAKTAAGLGDWSGNMTVRTDVSSPGQAINVAVETGYTSVGPVLMWQPPETDFAINLYFSICWKVDGLDLTCQNPIGPPPAEGIIGRRGHLRRCNCQFYQESLSGIAAGSVAAAAAAAAAASESSSSSSSSDEVQMEAGGGNQRCIPDLTKLCFLLNWAQFKDAVEMAQRRGQTTRAVELTFLIRARLRSIYRADTFMDGIDSMPVHLMMPLQRLKYLVSNPKPTVESEINQQTLIAGVIVAACVVLIVIAIVIFLSWRWVSAHHHGYMGPIGHNDCGVESAVVHYPNNLYNNSNGTTTMLPNLTINGGEAYGSISPGGQLTTSLGGSNGHGRHNSNGTAARVHLPAAALKKYNEWRFPAIPVAEFATYVVRCHADSNHKFLEEWDEVNAATQKYPSVVCDLAENRNKNRYTDILCFDHSRVILHSKSHSGSKVGSDYINANFVDGYHMERAFIAAQGPVPDTFEDFWLMVWENSCPVIVMISNLVECGRRKCDKYWPSEGICTYGQMQVRFVRQVERSYYIYRVMALRRLNNVSKKLAKERIIHHYHYTEWPDFGVPAQPLQVLQFMQRSAAHWHGGPMVVHCSAGVGRTGTYICIEAQIRQINRERTVNIKAWLSHIRQQRVRLVQSEQQYYFIHDALAEYLLYPEHEVRYNHLRSYVNSLFELENCGCTRLQRQFQLCTSHQPDPSTQMVARKSFNLEKSRSDIYPLDKCRVKLTTVGEPYPQERADYINASQLTGFYTPREFIITQHPMEHTITDLWRMVWDQNSPHIILLSDMKGRCSSDMVPSASANATTTTLTNAQYNQQYENRELLDDEEDKEEEEDRLFRAQRCEKNLPQFWPSVNESLDYGFLQVAFRGCENLSQVVKTEFLMGNSRDDYSLVTNLWQYRSFPTNVPEALEMVRFVNLLQERNRDCSAPLIVMDALGGSRAAFFCALIYCLNQLSAESCVDVYMVVKMYHLQRPGVWSQPTDIDRVDLLYRTLEAVAQDLQSQQPAANPPLQSNGVEHGNAGVECLPLSRRLSFPPVTSSNGSAVRTSHMSASRCSTLVRHVYSTSGASASSNESAGNNNFSSPVACNGDDFLFDDNFIN